jgi:hypothetical protein
MPPLEQVDISVPETDQSAPAVAQSWKLLGEIEAAIRAADLKTVGSAGEALKGCVTSVLARQTFEAISILENASDGRRLDDALDACRRLREAIHCLHPGGARKENA